MNLTNAVRVIRSPHAAAGLPRTLRTPITQGAKYFDVTGATPDSVVYATNAADLIVWVTPPPAPSAPSSGPYFSEIVIEEIGEDVDGLEEVDIIEEVEVVEDVPATEDAAQATDPDAPMAAPASSQGTPIPEGTPETAPTGSVGTPLPADEPGMTPAGAAPEAVEGAAVEEMIIVEELPADAGSQGTPLPDGAAPVTTPMAPPPAS